MIIGDSAFAETAYAHSIHDCCEFSVVGSGVEQAMPETEDSLGLPVAPSASTTREYDPAR